MGSVEKWRERVDVRKASRRPLQPIGGSNSEAAEREGRFGERPKTKPSFRNRRAEAIFQHSLMRYLFGVFLVLLPLLVLASTPNKDINKQTREIADQLRCPVCRGIPIADSPSELAQNMIAIIRQKLEEGRSKEEILQYFEDRYGEWILLKPKPEGLNLMIWVLPITLLLGGLFFIFFRFLKK